MFALRRTLVRPMAVAAAAQGSGGGFNSGLGPRDRLIRMMKEKQRKGMVSDPATYPLMAIVGTALTFATGFILYFSLKNEDVRLNKRQRQQLMRVYDEEDKVTKLDNPRGQG